MSTKQANNHAANTWTDKDGRSTEQAFLRLGDVLAEIARRVNCETLEVSVDDKLLPAEQNGGEAARNRGRRAV